MSSADKSCIVCKSFSKSPTIRKFNSSPKLLKTLNYLNEGMKEDFNVAMTFENLTKEDGSSLCNSCNWTLCEGLRVTCMILEHETTLRGLGKGLGLSIFMTNVVTTRREANEDIEIFNGIQNERDELHGNSTPNSGVLGKACLLTSQMIDNWYTMNGVESSFLQLPEIKQKTQEESTDSKVIVPKEIQEDSNKMTNKVQSNNEKDGSTRKKGLQCLETEGQKFGIPLQDAVHFQTDPISQQIREQGQENVESQCSSQLEIFLGQTASMDESSDDDYNETLAQSSESESNPDAEFAKKENDSMTDNESKATRKLEVKKVGKIQGVRKCPRCNKVVDVRNPAQSKMGSKLCTSEKEKLRKKASSLLASHFEKNHLTEKEKKGFRTSNKATKQFKCIFENCKHTSMQYFKMIGHYVEMHVDPKIFKSKEFNQFCKEKGCSFFVEDKLFVGKGEKNLQRFKRETMANHVISHHDHEKKPFRILNNSANVIEYQCTRCRFARNIPKNMKPTNSLQTKIRRDVLDHFYQDHIKDQ